MFVQTLVQQEEKQVEQKRIKSHVDFQTGIRTHRTPLVLDFPFNHEQVLNKVEEIGGNIEYVTERTIHFLLEDVRVFVSHNWFNQKYVSVHHIGKGIAIGERIEKEVRGALESI